MAVRGGGEEVGGLLVEMESRRPLAGRVEANRANRVGPRRPLRASLVRIRSRMRVGKENLERSPRAGGRRAVGLARRHRGERDVLICLYRRGGELHMVFSVIIIGL